jgi:predicted transcriptional regulator
MKKRPITIIVDDSTVKELDLLAAANKRSRSQFIGIVIDDFLAGQTKISSEIDYEAHNASTKDSI